MSALLLIMQEYHGFVAPTAPRDDRTGQLHRLLDHMRLSIRLADLISSTRQVLAQSSRMRIIAHADPAESWSSMQ